MRAFAARIFMCAPLSDLDLVSATVGMTSAVAHFVSLEMRDVVDRPGRPFAVCRIRTMVSVVRIEVIVYMPMKIGGSMKPRANTDEDAVDEPRGAVISIRRTIVGCVIVISIGTIRRRADGDRDLSRAAGNTGRKK
jgi:hypothetical protein